MTVDDDHDAAVRWTDPDAFEVDGVQFVHSLSQDSTPERFVIAKPRSLVERYVAMVSLVPDATIVELGIFRGGSAALTALVARPRRLVVADLRPEPVAALERFVADRGLGATLRRRYGLDQADRSQVAALLDDEVGDRTVDLVIDDASHRYVPTLASFEVAFPWLAPGGRYCIEDWRSRAKVAQRMRSRRSGSAADPSEAFSDEQSAELARQVRTNTDALRSFAARLGPVLRDPYPPDHATLRAELERVTVAGSPERPAVAGLLRTAYDDPDDVNHDVVRRLVDGEPDSAVAHAVLHAPAGAVTPVTAPAERRLPDLAVELLRAHTARPDVIAELRADPDWVQVTRGPAPLERDGFTLASLIS